MGRACSVRIQNYIFSILFYMNNVNNTILRKAQISHMTNLHTSMVLSLGIIPIKGSNFCYLKTI